MATFEGALKSQGGRYSIVAARFNEQIVSRLVAGAVDGLRTNGVSENTVDLVWVPGSFEIPLIAQRLAASGKYEAVICLGAVIKGDTDHYEFVSKAATDGILQAGLRTGVPIIFGVLTCQTEQQAMDRAGGNEGNKGYDAAETAVRMVNLLGQLPT